MAGKKDKSDLPQPSSSSETDVDPISLALRPPADELPAMRATRLRDEAAAKKHSDFLDAQLQVEREEKERSKKRGDIKILLLGEFNSSISSTRRFSSHAHARSLRSSLSL